MNKIRPAIPLTGHIWDIDYSNWEAGGESINCTLKEEHCPTIPLKPLDANIKLYISIDYNPTENDTSIFIGYDIVAIGREIEMDMIHDDQEVYHGFLPEKEILRIINELAAAFRLRLIGNISLSKQQITLERRT